MHLRNWRLWLVLLVVGAVVWFSLGKLGNFLYQRGLAAQREWRLNEAASFLTWANRLQSNNQAARYQLGLTRQLQGDFLTSQQILTSLLASGVTNKEILSQIHNSIGINQYSFASPDEAINSHQLSLKLADEIRNKRLRAHALIGLGRAFYHSKGKVEEAAAKLEEARAIAREIDDNGIEAAAVRNLGVINWWFRAELDRPLNEFYLPALELYRSVNDQRGAATMLSLIALVFNSKGDVYNFLKYQTESIAIQERIGEQAGLSDSYMHMGMLYGGLGNYRKAREYYSRSWL